MKRIAILAALAATLVLFTNIGAGADETQAPTLEDLRQLFNEAGAAFVENYCLPIVGKQILGAKIALQVASVPAGTPNQIHKVDWECIYVPVRTSQGQE